MTGAVGDAHAVHYLGDAPFTLTGRHVVVEQRELDVFCNVQLVDQVKALENEADILLADVRPA